MGLNEIRCESYRHSLGMAYRCVHPAGHPGDHLWSSVAVKLVFATEVSSLKARVEELEGQVETTRAANDELGKQLARAEEASQSQRRVHEAECKMIKGVWRDHEEQFASERSAREAAEKRVKELEGAAQDCVHVWSEHRACAEFQGSINKLRGMEAPAPSSPSPPAGAADELDLTQFPTEPNPWFQSAIDSFRRNGVSAGYVDLAKAAPQLLALARSRGERIAELERDLEKAQGDALVAQRLAEFGCEHGHAPDKTPPMMYPEWIDCVVKSAIKKRETALSAECDMLRKQLAVAESELAVAESELSAARGRAERAEGIIARIQTIVDNRDLQAVMAMSDIAAILAFKLQASPAPAAPTVEPVPATSPSASGESELDDGVRLFQKKPVVVKAQQFRQFENCHGVWGWQRNAHHIVACLPSPHGSFELTGPAVITIHNQVTPIVDGDWIIDEGDGIHFYPCKPDIFERTYRPVETAPITDGEWDKRVEACSKAICAKFNWTANMQWTLADIIRRHLVQGSVEGSGLGSREFPLVGEKRQESRRRGSGEFDLD